MTKKKLKNFDNKLYSTILIINLIGIIIDILGYFSFRTFGTEFLINVLISKIYLIYYISYIFCLMLYVYNISFKNLNVYIKKIIYIFSVLCLLIFLLPISVHFENNAAFSYGLSVNVAYTIGFLMIGIMMFCLFKNIKNVKKKGYIPLIVFVLSTVLCMVIQKINPEITLLLTTNSIVTLLMYFTIENPDLKILNEVYRNKELVEQSYEDKSNFLFEMTQEVRGPLANIQDLCNKLNNEENVVELKKGLKQINNNIKQLDFVVNNVLDVSTLDVQKIKFVENRYNINNIYNEIVSKMHSVIPKEIEFRSTITNSIPYLYGDSIKLKQIILSLLLNSVKKTEKGFIEFNIDTIERYDICRLIVTIKDSGSGMSIDKINEILAATGELNQEDIANMEKVEINMKLCQKIVKMFGGNLMIKSDLGKGTEVVFSIDQRIVLETKDNYLDKYEYYVNSRKKVLIVSQDKETNNVLKKKLTDKNIEFSHILYGKDAIDKIKSGKKYDFIILDDDMKQMTGYTTLKELKEIDKFNIPTIIMLKENKENIKEHYINDGFADYILVSDLNKEIDKIIQKY